MITPAYFATNYGSIPPFPPDLRECLEPSSFLDTSLCSSCSSAQPSEAQPSESDPFPNFIPCQASPPRGFQMAPEKEPSIEETETIDENGDVKTQLIETGYAGFSLFPSLLKPPSQVFWEEATAKAVQKSKEMLQKIDQLSLDEQAKVIRNHLIWSNLHIAFKLGEGFYGDNPLLCLHNDALYVRLARCEAEKKNWNKVAAYLSHSSLPFMNQITGQPSVLKEYVLSSISELEMMRSRLLLEIPITFGGRVFIQKALSTLKNLESFGSIMPKLPGFDALRERCEELLAPRSKSSANPHYYNYSSGENFTTIPPLLPYIPIKISHLNQGKLISYFSDRNNEILEAIKKIDDLNEKSKAIEEQLLWINLFFLQTLKENQFIPLNSCISFHLSHLYTLLGEIAAKKEDWKRAAAYSSLSLIPAKCSDISQVYVFARQVSSRIARAQTLVKIPADVGNGIYQTQAYALLGRVKQALNDPQVPHYFSQIDIKKKWDEVNLLENQILKLKSSSSQDEKMKEYTGSD